MPLERRRLSRADLEAVSLRHRTWGVWGDDDELGAANYATPERVAAAAQEIRRGTVFSLALPMDNTGPMKGVNGRVNPQHLMLRTGADLLADPQETGNIRVTDDAVYMPLQASTQWDALCHIMFEGYAYNGRGYESVTSAGAKFNSVTNLKDRAVGRGVLSTSPGGWTGHGWSREMWCRPRISRRALAIKASTWRRVTSCWCGPATSLNAGLGETGALTAVASRPGLGVSAADFLCPRHVIGVATDTWGIEAIPYETDDVRAPLHVVLLVNAGVHIGEMWDLEALAEDCAVDGRYTFFLSAPPLTITGAVGSPLNPLAIK